MKNTIKILMAVVIALGSFSVGNAQSKQKFGHINSNTLLQLMPERTTAEKQLQDYAKQLESQLATMSTEYKNKLTDYQTNQATMSDVVKQAKAQEIADLEVRIQEFQQTAQQSLQEKESQLLQPLIDKAKKAIDDVAKENAFTYIFDSGIGVILHSPPADDILPLVKKKLGITE